MKSGDQWSWVSVFRGQWPAIAAYEAVGVVQFGLTTATDHSPRSSGDSSQAKYIVIRYNENGLDTI